MAYKDAGMFGSFISRPVSARGIHHGGMAGRLRHKKAQEARRLDKMTFSSDQLTGEDLDTYANIRGVQLFNDKNHPMTINEYAQDMLFVLGKAKTAQKPYFEFDGNRYRTDEEEAVSQLQAFVKARQEGKTSYEFNGKRHEACSRYPDQKQQELFGNIWEELRSPQSPETKAILRKCVSELSLIPMGSVVSPITRMYEICRQSGYPEISETSKANTAMNAILRASYGHDKAHYEPSTFGGRGEIYIPVVGGEWSHKNYEDVLGELAHAFRDKNNFFGETAQFVGDGLKDIFTGNGVGFGTNAQAKNYKNPDRMEYDAHEVVEPVLKSYITGMYVRDGKSEPGPSSIEGVFAKIKEKRAEQGTRYTPTPNAAVKASRGQEDKSGFRLNILGRNRKIDLGK